MEALRAAIDRYNETTKAVGEAHGVSVVDLDFMNGRLDYFYDDCHFNEAGAEVVAARVADAVIAAGMIREP